MDDPFPHITHDEWLCWWCRRVFRTQPILRYYVHPNGRGGGMRVAFCSSDCHRASEVTGPHSTDDRAP